MASCAALLPACRIPALLAGDGLFDYGTRRNEIAPVDGEHVDVGYFPVAGAGEYAVLTKANDKWALSRFADEFPQLEAGQERIFIQRRNDEMLQLTPVFEQPQEVYDGGNYFKCEQTERSYNPCNSKFTKGLLLLEDKRELDRREIERAVNESGLIPKLKQEWARRKAAEDLEERVAKQRSNIDVHVTKLENPLGLMPITEAEAQGLASTTASRTQAADVFSVAVAFKNVERGLSTATVVCSLTPDQPAYILGNVTTTERSTVHIKAKVDHCDVSDPHPASFMASQPGHVVTARVDHFDAKGSSWLTLNNTSAGYVTVSSVSVYYFDKIAVMQRQIELPPMSHEQVVLNTNLHVNSTEPALTLQTAADKTYVFGVAVKYTAGETASKTLLSLTKPTYKASLTSK